MQSEARWPAPPHLVHSTLFVIFFCSGHSQWRCSTDPQLRHLKKKRRHTSYSTNTWKRWRSKTVHHCKKHKKNKINNLTSESHRLAMYHSTQQVPSVAFAWDHSDLQGLQYLVLKFLVSVKSCAQIIRINLFLPLKYGQIFKLKRKDIPFPSAN